MYSLPGMDLQPREILVRRYMLRWTLNWQGTLNLPNTKSISATWPCRAPLVKKGRVCRIRAKSSFGVLDLAFDLYNPFHLAFSFLQRCKCSFELRLALLGLFN